MYSKTALLIIIGFLWCGLLWLWISDMKNMCILMFWPCSNHYCSNLTIIIYFLGYIKISPLIWHSSNYNIVIMKSCSKINRNDLIAFAYWMNLLSVKFWLNPEPARNVSFLYSAQAILLCTCIIIVTVCLYIYNICNVLFIHSI